jgi:hypothetical protein
MTIIELNNTKIFFQILANYSVIVDANFVIINA